MSELNEKIFVKVQGCLSQALGVDKEDVQAGSSLTRDLGAESIDFLDIIFRLEQSFNIKIPRGDLFPEQLLTSSEFVQNGKLTASGVTELKKRFIYTDFKEFEKDPLVTKLSDTFKVDSLVKYLENRLTAENIKI